MAPVDLSSQQQYQQSQNNLLDVATPNEIVVAPEMQNRMTYNTQPQPDMSAVNQYNDFNFIPTKRNDFYNKAESDITRQKDYIPVSQGGYEEPIKKCSSICLMIMLIDKMHQCMTLE